MAHGVAKTVNVTFFLAAALFALALVLLLVWSLQGASNRKNAKDGLGVLENAPRHVSNMSQIRQDFEKLVRIARIVALLSPQVSSSQEYDRLWLSITFRLRFEFTKLRLMMGSFILPQTDVLGQMVAALAAQIEMAMAKLGERAVLAAELVAQSDQ